MRGTWQVTTKAYDPLSTIFEIAKNIALQVGEGQTVRVTDLETRALMKGFKKNQVALNPKPKPVTTPTTEWLDKCASFNVQPPTPNP